jgi:hypothetical protein
MQDDGPRVCLFVLDSQDLGIWFDVLVLFGMVRFGQSTHKEGVPGSILCKERHCETDDTTKSRNTISTVQ